MFPFLNLWGLPIALDCIDVGLACALGCSPLLASPAQPEENHWKQKEGAGRNPGSQPSTLSWGLAPGCPGPSPKPYLLGWHPGASKRPLELFPGSTSACSRALSRRDLTLVVAGSGHSVEALPVGPVLGGEGP